MLGAWMLLVNPGPMKVPATQSRSGAPATVNEYETPARSSPSQDSGAMSNPSVTRFFPASAGRTTPATNKLTRATDQPRGPNARRFIGSRIAHLFLLLAGAHWLSLTALST